MSDLTDKTWLCWIYQIKTSFMSDLTYKTWFMSDLSSKTLFMSDLSNKNLVYFMFMWKIRNVT